MNHAHFRIALTLCISLTLGMQINLYANTTVTDIQQAQLMIQQAQKAQQIIQNYEASGDIFLYQRTVLQNLYATFNTMRTIQEQNPSLSNDWTITNTIHQLENDGMNYLKIENNTIPINNTLNSFIKYLTEVCKQKRSISFGRIGNIGKRATPPTRSSAKTPTSVTIKKEQKIVGRLGQEYLQKFDEIYEYDYTKSTRAGFPNLATSLEREIRNVNKDTFSDYPRLYTKRETASNPQEEKAFFIKPDPATMDDLKNTIDRLYRGLQRYRIRDNQ